MSSDQLACTSLSCVIHLHINLCFSQGGGSWHKKFEIKCPNANRDTVFNVKAKSLDSGHIMSFNNVTYLQYILTFIIHLKSNEYLSYTNTKMTGFMTVVFTGRPLNDIGPQRNCFKLLN